MITRAMGEANAQSRQTPETDEGLLPQLSQQELGVMAIGNRLNELALVPWIRGRNLMGDVTCIETLTSTHMRKPVIVKLLNPIRGSPQQHKYVKLFIVETLGP